MDPFEIIWEAPEYDHHAKDIAWYWVSIGIALILLVFAVWQRNYLFAFFIIVAEILIIVWAEKEPPHWHFTVNEKGVHIKGHKSYSYHHIHSFHVYEHELSPWDELLFHLKGKVHPTLMVKFPKAQAREIRQALSRHIPYVEKEESFADVLRRYLRF